MSANTLRNSVTIPRSIENTIDRFKLIPTGGHNALSIYAEGTFNNKTFHVPRKLNKEEIPNGRPLFKRELNKVVPAPNKYNVRPSLGTKKNPH
mmetsp:Transcript_33606/g.51759  ORF Transcript_33606/g.51759 Transcript_33606/m.51759 type:complete len:93 (+) Transcript_33606:172-450(+)